AWAVVRSELEKHDPALAARPEILVLTRCDLTGWEEDREELERAAGARVYPVSAVAGTGLRGRLRIGTPVIRSIARLWTAEAGVRDLRRRLDEVARKFSLRAATGEEGPFRVSAGDLPSLLGPPPVHAPERRR
ncbi:MAG: hypothetical protein L6R43_19915, partial [Planctomycetes bacterium]|nr:hypothetical protein [Planctomycetota bacterium]